MKTHNIPFRLTSKMGGLLIATVTSLASGWAHAGDTKHIVTDEKASSISAAMESSLDALPKIYESVCRSIVRVETPENINVTGVIVSSEGHVLVGNGPPGLTDLKVHLSDGRTVTATASGWSSEWRIGLVKIDEEGPWPAIELGSTRDLKAGEPCLVIGYPPRGDTKFDSSPTARLGFINRIEPTQWFTTTCFPAFFEVPAVVGMDGRLLGVDTMFAGIQSYETAVDVLVANLDDLFAGKNLDWVRCPPNRDSIYYQGTGDHPESIRRLRETDDLLGPAKPPRRVGDSELPDVRQIAGNTTVRLVSKDRLDFQGKDPDRWSGVIVSEDGYILTCGHTDQLPGERITVRLSDGRDADAVALGTNPVSDIGLVKITTPGPWPFAEIAESSILKPGDPLVVAGYPAIDLITMEEWSTERTPKIDTTTVTLPYYLEWNRELFTNRLTNIPYQGGMSGGGVFNQSGRYIAISQGNNEPTRSEFARAQWDELKQIKSIDTAIGIPHPLLMRFVAPGKSVAQSVVELLVDSEPVGIGTIVDADGWIITKASVLDGKVSCRLPDQSVVAAEKRAESQEHDLALLKIDSGGLSPAGFSDQALPPIAQVLCAIGPDQIRKPGIVSIETRAVPPESRWNGDATEDAQNGVMLFRSTNLNLFGTKLQSEDIIVSINGHATPDVATLTQVLETNLAGYCTGDLVSVAIRRKDAPLELLTTLPPTTDRPPVTGLLAYRAGDLDTPRRSGFAAVFDTDIELLQQEVGSPVIDIDGRIRGIAIVSRGREESQRGPTSVLPAHIAAHVTKQLMAEANSK